MVRTSRTKDTAPDLRRAYRHTGHFVLRTALLPFAALDRLHAEPLASPGPPSHGASSASATRVRAAFESSELREALLFSSRGLESRLDGRRSSAEELAASLARYATRGCTRTTPFGVWAGISLGSITTDSHLVLGPRASYRRHTRPSLGFLCDLLSRAAARAEDADQILHVPNPSGYWAWGRFRFSRTGADGQSHPVVDVTPTPQLLCVLERAAKGASLLQLARDLGTLGVELDDGLEYVRALVGHSVLVPVWQPEVTGREPFAAAIAALKSCNSSRPLAGVLESMCLRLDTFDSEPVGKHLAGLRETASELQRLGQSLGFECASPLQATLIKPAPALALGQDVVERLLRAAWLIQRTGTARPDESLQRFCTRFTERYGSAWVPLVEALDGDLGIGFGEHQHIWAESFLHGMGLAAEASSEPSFSEADALRLELLTRALASGAREVPLDDACLARFPAADTDNMPESFAVCAQLGLGHQGFSIVDPVVIAPSGVATIARFCQAYPQLEQAVRHHVELEQAVAGDRLLVDVVHLPDGDARNILLRPVLRDVEIAYAGSSGASPARQLVVSDIEVSVSQSGVHLRSRRLGRPLAVRITNAHDHGAWSNLPIYRFLGALQEADRRSLPIGWSWGVLSSSPFLPRIARDGIVLSCARWLLDSAELAPFEGLPPAQALEKMRAMRARLGIPRWVTLARGETPLVADLESPLGLECFSREAEGAERLAIRELLPAPDQLAVEGPDGKFVAEVVVPFVLRQPVASDAHASTMPSLAPEGAVSNIDRARAVRSHAPGSDWLYAKIYAGPSLLDILMRGLVRDLVPSLPPETTLWFFVPYADPDAHLRLRFRGDPSELMLVVLPALTRWLAPHQATGAVHRVQLDTYVRELERYGGPEGTDLAERAFQRDSEATARVRELCANQPELRWQLTVLGVDRLLADFAPELADRAQMAEDALEDHLGALGIDTAVSRAIGADYRRRAEPLRDILSLSAAVASPTDAARSARVIFDQRSRHLAAVVQQLDGLIARRQLSVGRTAFARSLIHMHVARMLHTRTQAHELVIYHHLRRQYATELSLRRSHGIRASSSSVLQPR